MAHFIYPQATSTTAFVLDGSTVSPTIDSGNALVNKGMPVVNLAGEGLGPLDVASGASGATTLRVVLSSDSTISIEEDHNFGVVGANTLRTAAQIGNATGAAAFGSGADSAQTLRVTPSTRSETATTPLAVRLSDGTAFYAGATETTVSAISGKLPATLGQKTMLNSLAVVVASDQSAIPVSGTVTATNAANGTLGAAAPTVATQIAAQLGGNLQYLSATAAGLLKVDGSGVTQPVSGSVTVSQATAASLNATVVGTGTFAVQAAQSGTWNLNNISGTISLPTGAATESTLSALNTKHNSDFGVSSGAIRVAAQVGNATGAAAFGTGASSAQTLRVVLADESKPQVGLSPVSVITRTYSTSNVTGTYTNLGTALPAAAYMLTFFETGGVPLIVGWGSVDKFIIPPGGAESPLPVSIPNGTQLQIKTADGSTVSSGNLYITVLGA